MKFTDEGGAAPEDMMERLLREQTFAAGDGEDDDDEDAMPDWAADGDDSASATLKSGLHLGFSTNDAQPTAKRSLLLEVCDILCSCFLCC